MVTSSLAQPSKVCRPPPNSGVGLNGASSCSSMVIVRTRNVREQSLPYREQVHRVGDTHYPKYIRPCRVYRTQRQLLHIEYEAEALCTQSLLKALQSIARRRMKSTQSETMLHMRYSKRHRGWPTGRSTTLPCIIPRDVRLKEADLPCQVPRAPRHRSQRQESRTAEQANFKAARRHGRHIGPNIGAVASQTPQTPKAA